MAKEGEKTLVPKLRFPEFQDETGWKNHKLSNLTEVVRGGSPRPIDAFITTEPDGLNWLKIGDVPKDSKYITSTEQKVLKTALSKTREVVPGDLILSNSMSFGRPFLSKIRTCIHDGWIAVTSLPDSFSRDFLYYSMMSEASQRYFENQAAGGGVRNLTVDIVKLLPVGEPLPAEQQKIADCLSSLDELIAAQGRKVEALKTYKRGLMQLLFPREGETFPRLRVPEFRDAPEWKKVKAGALFANRRERGDDSLPIYSVTMADGLVKRASLDRRIDDLAEAAGNKKVCRRDIAYNMMRMWQGACGVANEDCMVSPAYVVLSPQSDVHSPFYGYLFKLPQMLRLLTSHSRGLTEDRLRLYYQDFSGIPLPQPDVREQKQIADFLMSLDARIVTESGGLVALQSHKKGLMQQIFPSLEEA